MAKADFEKTLELDPNNKWAKESLKKATSQVNEKQNPDVNLASKAQAAYDTGDDKKAVELATKALEKDSNNLDARQTRIAANIQLGNNDIALADAEILAQGRPEDTAANYWLGHAQLNSGNHAEALNSLDKAAELNAKESPVNQERAAKIDKRKNEALAGLGASQPVDSKALAQQAQAAYDAGDDAKAVELATKALEKDPNNLDARQTRVAANIQLNHNDIALADAEILAQGRPEDTAANYWLGHAQLSSGNHAEALISLDKAAELNAKESPVNQERAAKIDKRKNEALAGLGASQPVDSKALAQQAQAAYDAGDDAKAVELATKALEKDPNNLDARQTRVAANIQLNHNDIALADAEILAQGRPEDTAANYWLGHAQLSSGNHAEALVSLDKAAELNAKESPVNQERAAKIDKRKNEALAGLGA